MLRVAALCVLFAGVALAGTTPEGQAFLEEYGARDGVTTLPSGLMYRVIKVGAGGGKTPQVSTPCEVHYRGTTITGEEFDSSYKRNKPATFAPNQVIKGWTEILQMMKEGDHYEVAIPSELAYGDRQRGKFITPGSVLVFELELLKVKGPSKDEL